MSSGFWLLWTVLILFSCFCAYRHRRAKMRIQQQQRQREINLIAYNGACNYPSSMLDLSFLASFKLPSYEEVAAQPSTPPPPYSSVFALQGGGMGGPGSSYPHHHHHCHPCPPYFGPGPSVLTSSQSSDNYTSCSCESCSLTSPCSTSFSVQVTDETYDSSRISTPSEAGGDCAVTPRAGVNFASAPSKIPPDVIPAVTPDVIPVQRWSPNGSDGISPLAPPISLPLHSRPSHSSRLPLSPLILLSSVPPGQAHPLILSDPLGAVAVQKGKEEEESSSYCPPPRPTLCAPKTAFVSSNVAAITYCNYKEEQIQEKEEEEEEEEDDEEDHFRHRRLTGDSGIEVCRCHVKREEREEEELLKGYNGKSGREAVMEAMKADVLHDRGDCSLQAGQSPLLDDCAEQRGRVSSGIIQKTAEAVVM
ncbi:proline-rich protein 7-like isoform X2 [Antennarius striatus]|uniref:proline-rich protein 7-like isoform X2 n=1 Tax=Antennarius striatus TaxID=241820 RepID=UPI0035B20C06